MKRILPKLLLFLLLLSTFLGSVPVLYAQSPFPTPDVPYSPNAEVNFVGKAAARSISFLNWTIENYYWQCFRPTTASFGECDNSKSPLIDFWKTIRNIVYAFFALFVLITAFILMTTRGKSLSVQRFLPRFIAVVILVTFSYSLIQVLYITTDAIQGFFLVKTASNPPELISARDLLYVGWNYETFQGLRKVDPYFDESVFVNLLLARMTAVTYYAMTGVLLIRKIILWFFIVVSPIFPVLLLYYPVRNTAKIWIGEFFRWLMYAPLFSVFLAGLVKMWQSGIPLLFNFGDALNGKIVYPTATNILLGGPGQQVSISNNLNVPDTFAQYVVSLIMLWVVLLLPFVLLQIFLDYLNSFSFNESPAIQKIINSSYSLLNKQVPPPLPPGSPPTGPVAGSGLAKQLPFAKYDIAKTLPVIREETGPTGAAKRLPFITVPTGQALQVEMNPTMLSSTNLSLPTIRDIANYEKVMLSSKDTSAVTKTVESLQKIANPTNITNPIERDRFVQLREQLVQQSQSGNSVAAAVLSAVKIVTNVSTVNNTTNRQATKNFKNTLTNIASPQKMTELHDTLVKESTQGNTLATTLLSNKETTLSQTQDMKSSLIRESKEGNKVASSIIATTMATSHQDTLSQVIRDVANNTTNVSDKEQVNQLHDTLVKESQQGNTLATAILASKDLSSTSQVSPIIQQLKAESDKGNQLAQSILSTAFNRVESKSLQQTFQQIVNPQSASSSNTSTNQEVLTKIHDTLVKESQQGNTLASTILSTKEVTTEKQLEDIKEKLTMESYRGNTTATTVLASTLTKEHTAELKDVFKEIASPSTIATSSVDKEKITALHDSLVKESQQGNTLATTILATNDKTTTEEITNIKEQLITQTLEGNKTASQILSTAITKVDNHTTQQVLNQLANPASITNTIDREKFTNLKEKLKKAEQEGNPLATTVMSTVDKLAQVDMSKPDIQQKMQTDVQKVKEQLLQAKEKGEPLAADLLHAMNTQTSDSAVLPSDTTLPSSNRIQSVSLEDYEAVKNMWQENYKDLDVPEGLANRKEWVSSDLNDIDNIINLLSSEDQQQVQQGMQEVSNILPFLMLGGFSKDEIISYLTAKKEAGKNVLEVIQQEEADEDTMLSVEKRHATNAATMSQSLSVSESEGEESAQLNDAFSQVKTISVNTEMLQLTNLPMPSMKDIVRFEVSIMSKDGTNKQEVTNVRDTLLQIANPSIITSTTDRERVEQMRDQLVRNSQQGDQLATNILTTANKIAGNNSTISSAQFVASTKQVFSSVANPEQIKDETAKQQLTQLHNTVQQEKEKGNPLAAALLAVNDATPSAEVEKLHDQLVEAKVKGDVLADTILPLVPGKETFTKTADLPLSNRIQTVSAEDYEAVKDMWKESYKSVEVPSGMNDRKEWISQEVQNIDQIISLLSSADEQQRAQGMDQVANILPFLMLGGFSQEEIISYLKAKSEAGKTVLQTINEEQQNEETMLSVASTSTPHAAIQSQAVAVEESDDGSVPLASTSTSPSFDPQQHPVLQMTQLMIPSLKDIARYELLSKKDDIQTKEEVAKAKELLQKIADPSIASADEKERIATIRETLTADIQKGDSIAASILQSTQLFPSAQPTANAETMSEGVKELQRDVAQNAMRGNHFAGVINTVQTNVTDDEVKSIRDEWTKEVKDNHEVGTKLTKTILLEVPEIRDAWFAAMTNPIEVTDGELKSKAQSVHDSLMQEKDKGNQLAASILQSGSQSEDEKKDIIQQLHDQSDQGNTLATDVLSLATSIPQKDTLKTFLLKLSQNQSPVLASALSNGERSNVVLPEKNAVQSVSLADYEAVRQMWKENYQNLEVPVGMADRKEWLSAETAEISEIMTLLSSTNVEENKKGMDKVANILPFLLLGGFSKEEIVSYMQAKLDAGKSVIQAIETNAAEQVLVPQASSAVVQEEKHMVTEVHEGTAEDHTTVRENNREASTITNEKTVESTPLHIKPEINIQLLQSARLPLPTLRDLMKYELGLILGDKDPDKERRESILRVLQALHFLVDPENIQDEEQRKLLRELKEEIKRLHLKGDVMAAILLSAADVADKKSTDYSRILPQDNPVQAVTDEEYDAVKAMWEEYYEKAELPLDASDRKVWLQKDIEKIQTVLSSLTSGQETQVGAALQQVSTILPFVLLGGFSQNELTTYLRVKIEAARTVLKKLKDEDAGLEFVDSGSASVIQHPATMKIEGETSS